MSSSNSTPVVHKDIAFGTAHSTHWFGIGGIKKDALVYQARQDMMRNRPLTGAEQYNAITVDVKHSFFLFYHKMKVTMYADVVEPKKNPTDPTYSEVYREKTQGGTLVLSEPNLEDELLKVGDTIYYNRYDKGIVVSLADPKKVTVSVGVYRGELKTKVKARKNVYSPRVSYRGLNLGAMTKQGEIIGFSQEVYLVKESNGNHLILPYE